MEKNNDIVKSIGLRVGFAIVCFVVLYLLLVLIKHKLMVTSIRISHNQDL